MAKETKKKKAQPTSDNSDGVNDTMQTVKSSAESQPPQNGKTLRNQLWLSVFVAIMFGGGLLTTAFLLNKNDHELLLGAIILFVLGVGMMAWLVVAIYGRQKVVYGTIGQYVYRLSLGWYEQPQMTTGKDELTYLRFWLNKLSEELQQFAQLTLRIANGEAVTLSEPRHDNDLAYSTLHKLRALIEKKEEIELSKRFFDKGLALFDNLTLRNDEPYSLSQDTAKAYVEYLGANEVAIYAAEKSTQDTILKRIGFAGKQTNTFPDQTTPSNGVLGQAFTEKRLVKLKDSNLIVLPLLFRKKSIGVMAVSTLEPLKDEALRLLAIVCEKLAAILSVQDKPLYPDLSAQLTETQQALQQAQATQTQLQEKIKSLEEQLLNQPVAVADDLTEKIANLEVLETELQRLRGIEIELGVERLKTFELMQQLQNNVNLPQPNPTVNVSEATESSVTISLLKETIAQQTEQLKALQMAFDELSAQNEELKQSLAAQTQSITEAFKPIESQALNYERIKLELQARVKAENTLMLISETDLLGRITAINEPYLKISGYSIEEVIGETHRIFKSEQMTDGTFEVLWKTLKSGEPWFGEMVNKSKQGELFYLKTAIFPIFDENGQPLKYLSMNVDLMPIKNLEIQNKLLQEHLEYQEELIRQQNEEFLYYQNKSREKETLLNARLAMFNGVCMVSETDLNGVITFVNEQALKRWGYQQHEVLGKSHNLIKSGAHNPAFFQTLWQTITNGQLWRGEIRNTAKDGTDFWVLYAISPVVNHEKTAKGYIAIGFDITKIKRQSNRLKVMLEEGKSQQKMLQAAIDQAATYQTSLETELTKVQTLLSNENLMVYRWIIDETLTVVDANEATLTLMELDAKTQLSGMSLETLIHPDNTQVWAEIITSYSSAKTWRGLLVINLPSKPAGQRVLAKAAPNNLNQLVIYAIDAEDLVPETQIEAVIDSENNLRTRLSNLQAQLETLQTFVDQQQQVQANYPPPSLPLLNAFQTALMFFEMDTRGNVIQVNQNLATRLGLSMEQLAGQPLPNLVVPTTPQTTYESMVQTLQTGNNWQGRLTFTTRTTDTLTAQVFIAPEYDNESNIERFACVVVEESVPVLQVYENAPGFDAPTSPYLEKLNFMGAFVAVAETDLQGNIRFVNERFTKQSGYAAHELIGTNIRIFKSDLQNPVVFTDLWATVTRGKIWYGELINRQKNGDLFWVTSCIIPVLNEHLKPVRYFNLWFDTTDMKIRVEKNIQRTGYIPAPPIEPVLSALRINQPEISDTNTMPETALQSVENQIPQNLITEPTKEFGI